MSTTPPYARFARVYDVLYDELFDPAVEVAALHRSIERRAPGARTLLDVACGTGRHLSHLQRHFRVVEGVDREPAMLHEARRKLTGARLTKGDLLELNLPRRFDVVTCLFSSIAYVKTVPHLRKAVANLARHLRPGGLLVIDGWILPENWSPGFVVVHQARREGITVVRISRSGRRGRVSTMEWHVLAADSRRILHFVETHELGLFTRDEYLDAIGRAGLRAEVQPGAADGRDRYFGVAPAGLISVT